MELDYMEKENTRLNYFSNIYLIVATLLMQLPYIFNWIAIDNIDGVISINTMLFLFSGFMMSLIGSSRVNLHYYKDEEEVENKIWFLKSIRKAGKALEYVHSFYLLKYLSNEEKNIRHYLAKCYNKTTANYRYKLISMRSPKAMNIKTIIGITFQSLFITFIGELMKQMDLSWYEVIVSIITMILGGIYGYKSGINLAIQHDINPINNISLLLDRFFLENNIEYKELDWGERHKYEFYNLSKDEIIEFSSSIT